MVIGIDVGIEHSAVASVFKLSHGGKKFLGSCDGLRFLQVIFDRGDAKFFGASLIHEALVEIANLLLIASGFYLPLSKLFNYRANLRLTLITQRIKGTIGGAVIGDCGALDPCPVHMAIKIILHSGCAVNMAQVYTALVFHMR